MLVRFLFLSVLPSKAFFIYIVRSPRFIPSPRFILSPESASYTWFVFYTQSAVRGPQSVFYTDRLGGSFVYFGCSSAIVVRITINLSPLLLRYILRQCCWYVASMFLVSSTVFSTLHCFFLMSALVGDRFLFS